MTRRNRNMRRIGGVVIGTFLALAAASAQGSPGLSLYASSGMVLPSSPMSFANYWKMQVGGSLGVGYTLTPLVTATGTVEYYRFRMDEEGIRQGFDAEYLKEIWLFTEVSLRPSAGTSSVVAVSANARLTPTGMGRVVTAYGVVGAGVMRLSMAEISVPTTNILTLDSTTAVPFTAERTIAGGDRTAAYVQVGLGAEFEVTATVKPFIEARYVLGFTKGMGTIYIPLTAGVKVQL